ncbi:unnamed protein product [Rhizophagus irregularis]|nr:unnamed protein product [Rhizophagus irregularis]
MGLFSYDETYGRCEECNQINTGPEWCNACNATRLQKNFIYWTSGNGEIDKFIQDAQLSANKFYRILEWIPYERFYDIEYIAKGGFGLIYKAKWTDGYIQSWNNDKQNWNRCHPLNKFVTSHYKIYNISTRSIVTFYGITQDPETENYMMVLDYAENGSLRNYLDKNYNNLTWNDKVLCLYCIATGLYHIHRNEPANCESTKDNTYGVLPYMAPEILRGQNYNKAADIYYHDEALAIKICQGLRPSFNIKVPQLILHTIKRCLDANPLTRPNAHELKSTIEKWNGNNVELNEQIKEAEEINNNLPINTIISISLTSSHKMNTHPKLFTQVDYLILIIFLNQKIQRIIITNMKIYQQIYKLILLNQYY